MTWREKVGGWRKIWCGMSEGGALCSRRRAGRAVTAGFGIWRATALGEVGTGLLGSRRVAPIQSMGSFPGTLASPVVTSLTVRLALRVTVCVSHGGCCKCCYKKAKKNISGYSIRLLYQSMESRSGL
jgi:hypothetical protein